jgi:hypothetical protein
MLTGPEKVNAEVQEGDNAKQRHANPTRIRRATSVVLHLMVFEHQLFSMRNPFNTKGFELQEFWTLIGQEEHLAG